MTVGAVAWPRHEPRVGLTDLDRTYSSTSAGSPAATLSSIETTRSYRLPSATGSQLELEITGDVLPEWLDSVIQAAAELLLLEPDWNSYGAKPIELSAVGNTIVLLTQIMQAETPAPSLIPTTYGGVQAEWHERGLDIQARVESPGLVYFYCLDQRSGEEQEAQLSTDLSPLSETISELTRRR